MNTKFLSNFARELGSAKFRTAAYAATAAFFAVKYAAPTVPPDQKAILWSAFIVAASVLFGVVINGWTNEDVADSLSDAASPDQPTNASPAPVASFGNNASPPIAQTSIVKQAAIAAVKLPFVLIGLLMLSLLAGCANNVPYVAFREGLAKVDESLYQQHQQLIADAVKAGIRTPIDQQVVQAEIAEAESLYATSRKDTAAADATPIIPTTPTTLPAGQ